MSQNKPAWNVSKPAAAPKTIRSDNEFPTAAEVAKGLYSGSKLLCDNVSLISYKGPSSTVPVKSAAAEARLEEADAFRGLHLDPNAHHWDEVRERLLTGF